jgi:TRAP-type C4-dicarboxylate transport system substrate-binding protein
MKKQLLIAAAAALLVSAPTAAQQVIKLTVVGAPPPNVTPSKVTKEYFVPEVTRRLAGSGYRIEWTEAYAQTLAKFTEVFETVEEGVGHIGVLLKNFEEAKLPLEQYSSLVPFGATDPDTMLAIDAKVHAKIPEMNAAFLKYNQIALSHSASAGLQLLAKFPVQKVEDIKGRKIGASGATGQILRGTGAVIVTANMAQSYTDLSNGVYDGYPIGMLQAFPYKTYQAAPYFHKFDFLSTTAGALSVNKKTWDSLPEAVRKAIQEVGARWGEEYARWEKTAEQQVIAQMQKEGLKIVDLPAGERKRWAMMMPNIAKEWAQDLDKKGQPGSKVLATYMSELRAAKIPLVREWDKE